MQARIRNVGKYPVVHGMSAHLVGVAVDGARVRDHGLLAEVEQRQPRGVGVYRPCVFLVPAPSLVSQSAALLALSTTAVPFRIMHACRDR